MTHPRLTVPPNMPNKGLIRQINKPTSDLLREPEGDIDCQLLYGAGFQVLSEEPGWSFGQILADDYVGYIRSDDLSDFVAPTHKITALGSHIYTKPNMKSPVLIGLPFASQVHVSKVIDGFCALTNGGFIPHQHLLPIDQITADFVATFERFLGIPYLWGGNSTQGMDCSGALQLALNAAGQDCPRDSDMQETDLGTALAKSAPLQRGDLVFWKGHIGVMRDSDRLIHANAHHMAVASEPLKSAIMRIVSAGGGPVTSYRRL